MWGNTVGPYLIARNSKTYRNFSTTQTILDTPDKSLYTDNNKTTVSFKERKWWNFQKKTIWYNFMKTKIWYFHPFSRQFIVRPMGQWANLMPTSCPRCCGLSRMCSYNFLLRLDKKMCNYAWAISIIPIKYLASVVNKCNLTRELIFWSQLVSAGGRAWMINGDKSEYFCR